MTTHKIYSASESMQKAALYVSATEEALKRAMDAIKAKAYQFAETTIFIRCAEVRTSNTKTIRFDYEGIEIVPGHGCRLLTNEQINKFWRKQEKICKEQTVN